MLTAVVDEALRNYGKETALLRVLPENRYNRRMFPAQGQYDWFSGQALYCLVRHLRPRQVVEISCANGYSSLFMALALRENASGVLETFELSAKNARGAQENFRRFGVEACVRLHVGDARRTVREIPLEKTGLLFLDSLHSEAFARSYLETLLPRLGARVPGDIPHTLPPAARPRAPLPRAALPRRLDGELALPRGGAPAAPGTVRAHSNPGRSCPRPQRAAHVRRKSFCRSPLRQLPGRAA